MLADRAAAGQVIAWSRTTIKEDSVRVGIATDHGGFGQKEELVAQLRAVGPEVVDFGAHGLTPSDDYPDFVVQLARVVAEGKVERGVAICGRGVGASVCANKAPGPSAPGWFTTTSRLGRGSRTIT